MITFIIISKSKGVLHGYIPVQDYSAIERKTKERGKEEKIEISTPQQLNSFCSQLRPYNSLLEL